MATFDENGNYIKTDWKAGDKITATKLNKIEESIEAVNNNDISRHVEADARLDKLESGAISDKQEMNAKVDALEDVVEANKDATDLEIYNINAHMTLLDKKIDDGVAEVEVIASTVDGKIATAETNMQNQVNQGKADMEAMVAEVEGELESKVDIDGLDFINVKDFGVIGDGQTDDTAAIQNLLDNSSIRTIYFPKGKYNITETLIIRRSGLKIVGDTKYCSRIVNTSSCDAIHIMENCERGVIKDIGIFGNDDTVFAPNSITKKGIVFFNFACQWYIENVWMRGHGEEFIYICGNGHVNNIYISNSEFEYGKTNCMKIYQNSVANQVNAIHIKDCCISGFGGDCLQLWGQSISVQNCAIQNSKGRGIVIDGILPNTDILNGSHTRSLSITDNYFELINQEFIFLQASYTPYARYIDGVTVENNYGFYSQTDEFNSENLYLVKVITPDYSRFTRMFNGFTYRANSFDTEGCKGELDAGNCNNTNSIFISNRFTPNSKEDEEIKYKNLGNANVFGRVYGNPIELFGKLSCVSHSFDGDISEVVGDDNIVFQLPCGYKEINKIQIDVFTTSDNYNFSVLGVRDDGTTNPIAHTFTNSGNSTQVFNFTNANMNISYKSIILKCSHVKNNNDTKIGNLIIFKK